MTKNSLSFRDRAGLISAAAILATLGWAGCVYPNDGHARGYSEGPPGPPPAVVVVQDDYVYYPQYEVYYSSSRHQYGYRDGNAWAWRPAPPQVSLNVLVASPSVHMDFHDTPDRHHSTVVQQYPKNWKPAADNHGGKGNQGNDKKDDKKDDHKGGQNH